MTLSEISLLEKIDEEGCEGHANFDDLPSKLIAWSDWFAQQLSAANIDFLRGLGEDADGCSYVDIVFMQANRSQLAGVLHLIANLSEDKDEDNVQVMLYDSGGVGIMNEFFDGDMSKLHEHDILVLSNIVNKMASGDFITYSGNGY